MTERNASKMAASGPDSPHHRRDDVRNTEMNLQNEYPYGDTGSLYEIPRIRPEDPPMRRWWIDDETQQDGSGSLQNG